MDTASKGGHTEPKYREILAVMGHTGVGHRGLFRKLIPDFDSASLQGCSKPAFSRIFPELIPRVPERERVMEIERE